MKNKKKNSLISKRNQPITKTGGNKKPIPKTLKPLRARQLIRRFHVLLKYKSSILNRLNELNQNNNNLNFEVDNYIKWINKNEGRKEKYTKAWEDTWNELKINKTPDSVIDPTFNDKIDKSIGVEELIKILGNIDSEIEKRGGLETYQIASTLGQDGKRGGDSSKLLVKWLKEIKWDHKDSNALEIGCLSSKNEISKCKLFNDIKRIDLHSQEPGVIEEQDFLERPIPTDENDKFDCISCSLVVNFVPTPELRGEMLCRMCEFLKNPTDGRYSIIFFVLPLPCVENSRYWDLNTMNSTFEKLGFNCIKYHQSNKLAYWLLKWGGSFKVDQKFTIKKVEIRKGNHRNNFSIVIK